LLRYEEGNFYIEHTDSFKAQQRSLSCSLLLNHDYDGGEFAFFNRQMMIKSKKGSVIMFPSNFMFPHEIMEVTKGTRYSIITWLV
jgi:predicted 2-oxoglutarate/Fe(II)-dependent dioxygenase YbiX